MSRVEKYETSVTYEHDNIHQLSKSVKVLLIKTSYLSSFSFENSMNKTEI